MNDRTTSDCKEIPRRVLISDPSDITGSYSSTPGGTLYSTTPGGTRIVYERSFLLNMRNSPLSRTPPSWEIPDALQKRSPKNGIIAPPMNDKKQKRNKPIAKRQTKSQVTKTNNSIEEIEQFPLEL